MGELITVQILEWKSYERLFQKSNETEEAAVFYSMKMMEPDKHQTMHIHK